MALQSVLLLAALLVIYDGFTGSPIAPKNLAGVLPWVQWRGLTVLSLLLAGSLFCTACPFVLVRRLAKRFLPANLPWPARLRGKWLAALLLAAFFWFYEAMAPWATPWLTAGLTLTYLAGAFIVDGLFRGAAFCRYLCPIGQFNFFNSTCSPLEVRARDLGTCRTCTTKDCIAGRNGCELFLFQPQKVGNLDCTFCLDCMHACPHENVGILTRLPLRELWDDRRRSGLGRLSERTDVAFLALVLVSGGFLNAFGMVGPYYAFEKSLMAILETDLNWLVLLVVFGFGLIVLPASFVSLAAATSRKLARSATAVNVLATRFTFALVPLGFGMWAAHYGFHFLTGGLTIVPVTQGFVQDAGIPLLGTPRWDLAALVPTSWLLPIEIALLEAGLLGTLVASYQIAQRAYGRRSAALGFLPWELLALLLFAAGIWLMLQPMEMRGTLRAG